MLRNSMVLPVTRVSKRWLSHLWFEGWNLHGFTRHVCLRFSAGLLWKGSETFWLLKLLKQRRHGKISVTSSCFTDLVQLSPYLKVSSFFGGLSLSLLDCLLVRPTMIKTSSQNQQTNRNQKAESALRALHALRASWPKGAPSSPHEKLSHGSGSKPKVPFWGWLPSQGSLL